MQNVIPDERYSVADEAILGAFFKLLKEKKPDRITVSDITKTAGIARSTFYNHYQDIPSLISAVEDKTIHDVFSMMENFQPKNDRDICSSYFLTLCRYTMENPFLSGLLSTPHGNDLFEKMLTMLHHYVTETTSNSRPDRHTKEEVSYVITCAIGSTIGVLHKWSRDNFNLAPEVIADILSEVFYPVCFHFYLKPLSYSRGSSIRTSCLLIFFVVLRINGFLRTTNPVMRR